MGKYSVNNWYLNATQSVVIERYKGVLELSDENEKVYKKKPFELKITLENGKQKHVVVTDGDLTAQEINFLCKEYE